jgi:hypothetical protein
MPKQPKDKNSRQAESYSARVSFFFTLQDQSPQVLDFVSHGVYMFI